MTLLDKDGLTLTCTTWGQDAEQFEDKGGAVGVVLAIKSARLSDFNGAHCVRARFPFFVLCLVNFMCVLCLFVCVVLFLPSLFA